MAAYHELTTGCGSNTIRGGEIDATRLQQTRFSMFAEQVNAAPMATNDTFLQQIIALSVPLEGVEETLLALKSRVRMGIITNGFSLPQRGRLDKLGWNEWFEPPRYLRRGASDQAGRRHLPARPGADGTTEPGAGADGGDNPKTDIAGAAAQGLATCW